MVHPIMISLCVIITVLLTVIFIGSIFSRFWLSYVILLVFLGGLLVLFVYISSLSGNEPVFIYFWRGVYLLLILVGLNLLVELWSERNYYYDIDIFYSLISVYFLNNLFFIGFLLFYLFFLLLVVTDLTKFMIGPLKIIYGK